MKFTTSRYPGLTLQDDEGIWAQFVGGSFETTDAAVIKKLKALPDDYEVSAVAKDASAKDGETKADGDGGAAKTDGGK